MSKPIRQIFVWMLLTLAGSSSAFAQELDEDCRPIPLPAACQPVAEQLALSYKVQGFNLRAIDAVNRGIRAQEVVHYIHAVSRCWLGEAGVVAYQFRQPHYRRYDDVGGEL